MIIDELIQRIKQLPPQEREYLRKALDEDPLLGNIIIKLFPEFLQMLGNAPPGVGQMPSGIQAPGGGGQPMPQPGGTPMPSAGPQQSPLSRVR